MLKISCINPFLIEFFLDQKIDFCCSEFGNSLGLEIQKWKKPIFQFFDFIP